MDEIHGKREDGTVQIRVDGDLTGKTADSIISGGHLEAEINGSSGYTGKQNDIQMWTVSKQKLMIFI